MKCKHVSDLWLFHKHFLVWYVTYWETLANRLHVSSSTTTSVKPLLVFTLKRILYVLLRIGVFIKYSYFNTFSFLLYIYIVQKYIFVSDWCASFYCSQEKPMFKVESPRPYQNIYYTSRQYFYSKHIAYWS